MFLCLIVILGVTGCGFFFSVYKWYEEQCNFQLDPYYAYEYDDQTTNKKLDSFYSRSLEENKVSYKDKVRQYKFSRGIKYSCTVKVVGDGDQYVFDEVTVPQGTTDETLVRLLEEAERFTIEQVRKEK